MFPKKTFLSVTILTVLVSSFLMPTSFGMKGAYPGENGMIAFCSLESTGGDFEIYIMNGDGTEIQQITFDEDWNTDPCWSPDSEKIAFQKGLTQSEIYYIHKDGTGLTQVTTCPEGFSHRRPAWSPDGEKIAYSRIHHYSPFEWDVYVIQIGAVGEGDKLIENADYPSWSPNGAMIAYRNNTDGKIWVADSTTGTPIHNVTSGSGSHPCWSPDGQRIAYVGSNDAIYVVNVDGSNQQQISFPPSGYVDESPNWSPDGSKILFHRESDSIWIKNGGTEPYDLTPDYPTASDPDWARAEPPPSVGGEILPTNMWIPWLIPLLVLLSIGAIFAVRKTELLK